MIFFEVRLIRTAEEQKVQIPRMKKFMKGKICVSVDMTQILSNILFHHLSGTLILTATKK